MKRKEKGPCHRHGPFWFDGGPGSLELTHESASPRHRVTRKVTRNHVALSHGPIDEGREKVTLAHEGIDRLGQIARPDREKRVAYVEGVN